MAKKTRKPTKKKHIKKIKTKIKPGKKTAKHFSPVEKILQNRYGQKGTVVYHMIDGKKSSGVILKKSKLSKSKLFEMLNFMEQHGIIKLDRV